MNHTVEQNENKQVLVVDDDTTIRVAEAADGEAALTMLADILPDVILLDVMLPGIDGFTVCRQIRNHPDGKYVAVLMMTGLDDVVSIKQAYSVGATDFITKPINWRILGYRVNYMHRANQAFQELSKNRAQLLSAQKIAHLGSWDWDRVNDKFRWSSELYHIFALDPATCTGTYDTFIGIIHPLEKERVKMTIEEAVGSQQPFRLDYKIVLADGTERFVSTEGQPVSDRQGRFVRVTGTVQDITERKQAEVQIRSLALYDNLTGLPNRILFYDRLEQAVRQAVRQHSMVAVMFIDLDQFKDINDSMGHNAGDMLLREVGQRLLSVTRSTDTVARLGGDEFTLCLQNVPSLDVICTLAQKLMDTFSEPFTLESKIIFVTASIGVAVYPNDAGNADDLLKQADTAMYFAKEQGKNNYKLFSPEMQIETDTRLTLQSEIRLALERNEFCLHYQPQFDTLTGKLKGMEALIRWKHPDKGVVFPNTFIPVAEATGLIVPLGKWILSEACRQNVAWQAMGYEPIKIAVNISAVQFKRSNIVDTIRRVFECTGMAPHLLQIEITESSLMQLAKPIVVPRTKGQPGSPEAPSPQATEEDDSIINTLDTLQKMGVSIALDDFGTGYSLLSHLCYSFIDVIKIDRRFVWAINAWEGSEIISTIIETSKKLSLQVTAEGVETEYQKTYLLKEGCHEVQGYLIGKPSPAEDCVKYFTQEQEQFVKE
ncbi:MAG: EAL domain-containing protein [Deltaproteobacteria bacterium]|nr:EAL domain-containing protein [Deltaproteobacteria bacterium]